MAHFEYAILFSFAILKVMFKMTRLVENNKWHTLIVAVKEGRLRFVLNEFSSCSLAAAVK